MLLLPCAGKKPRIHRSAWIAPNATIIGDVEIGPDSSVFYGSVLRGDVGAIRIGARCNIQDNCVFHVEEDTPCVLEDDVTVGHMAMVHAAHVEAGSLVGMSSSLPACQPKCAASSARKSHRPSLRMLLATWTARAANPMRL